MPNPEVLRAAYRANGSFSLASAAVFIVMSSDLSSQIGLRSVWPLVVIGAGLVPFGLWLFWLARGPGLTASMGRTVSMMDASWILATIVLLAGWPDLLNPTGRALASSIAGVVAIFAVWQWAGVRRLGAPTS